MIDNTIINSTRLNTLPQVNERYDHKIIINDHHNTEEYQVTNEDDDRGDDCIVQIRSRFLYSRKRFNSNNQEDKVLKINKKITPYNHTTYDKKDVDNISNNHIKDDNHKNNNQNSMINVDEITNKLVRKTNSQSSNYH